MFMTIIMMVIDDHDDDDDDDYDDEDNDNDDILVLRRDGSLMCFHPTLRDWLLRRRSGESERQGEIFSSIMDKKNSRFEQKIADLAIYFPCGT